MRLTPATGSNLLNFGDKGFERDVDADVRHAAYNRANDGRRHQRHDDEDPVCGHRVEALVEQGQALFGRTFERAERRENDVANVVVGTARRANHGRECEHESESGRQVLALGHLALLARVVELFV